MSIRREETLLVVSLCFPRLELAHLEHVRGFLNFLRLAPHQVGEDLLSDLTVSAHELMENAIKYGRDDGATLELRAPPREPSRLLVRTKNKASQRDAGRAGALVDRLTRGDPRAVYQEVLRESAARAEGSGLGLMRIAAECGMTLSTRFHRGVLHIDAWSNARRTRHEPAVADYAGAEVHRDRGP